jgi:hypothetical protein
VTRRGQGVGPARACLSALLLVAVTLLAGCSQGARQDQVDALRASVPRVIAGTFALDLRPIEIRGSREVDLPSGTLAAAAFVADPRARRTALQVKPGGPSVYLSDGHTLYARRPLQSASQRRPWARLEVKPARRTDKTDKPTLLQLATTSGPGDAVIVDPQLLIDLLSGALTGSIKRGPRSADGTTPYTFNVSIDKAARTLHLSEDVRKNRTKVLASLAITDDVHEARAALRADGSLAGFAVRFTERPDKQAALALTAAIAVQPSPPPANEVPKLLAVPDRATTVRVPSIGDIRTALAQRLGKP